MQNLQRAVDKIVLYERNQSLRKYDSLPNALYYQADFLVHQFEPGCIQIPLVNEAVDFIATRFRGILQEPYEVAADEHERLYLPLQEQIPAALNRAIHANPERHTQELLIQNPRIEREYAKVAVLQEVSQLISPVRSKRATEDDSISITVSDDANTGVYYFNKPISNRFKRIVSSKKLGPETVYRGHLRGLEATNYRDFPFSGKFVSLITESEIKLLIHSEDAALALSPFNLSPNELLIWGAPITTYGAFDEVRGDIVFLDFIR